MLHRLQYEATHHQLWTAQCAQRKSPTEFSQVGRPLQQTQNCKTGTNRILNQISLMHKLHGTYIGYTHEVPKSKNKLNQTGSTRSNCSQGWAGGNLFKILMIHTTGKPKKKNTTGKLLSEILNSNHSQVCKAMSSRWTDDPGVKSSVTLLALDNDVCHGCTECQSTSATSTK